MREFIRSFLTGKLQQKKVWGTNWALIQERKFSPKRKFSAGHLCGHPAKNFGQALQILEKKQAFRNGHPTRTSMKKLRSEKLRADFPFPNISETMVLSWHVCRTKLAQNIFIEARIFSRKMLRSFPRNVWGFLLWVRKIPQNSRQTSLQISLLKITKNHRRASAGAQGELNNPRNVHFIELHLDKAKRLKRFTVWS